MRCEYDGCEEQALPGGKCIFHCAIEHPLKDVEIFESRLAAKIKSILDAYQRERQALKVPTDKQIATLHRKHHTNLRGFIFPGDCTIASGVNIDLAFARVHGEARFTGSNIEGHLSLHSAIIEHGVDLNASAITGTVSLFGIQSKDSLHLSHVDIKGNLNFGRLQTTDGIYMAQAKIGGYLYARGAQIEGDWIAPETTVGGFISLEGVACSGSIRLSQVKSGNFLKLDAAAIEEDLDLDGCLIKGDLDCTGISVGKEFDVSRAELHANFDCDRATIRGGFYAMETHVGGEIRMPELTVGGNFSAVSITVAGNMYLHGATVEKEASFLASKVWGRLDLRDCKFHKNLELLFLRTNCEAYFYGSRVAKDFLCYHAEFPGGCDFREFRVGGRADFNNAKIGKSADFSPAYFDGTVDFTGTIFYASGRSNFINFQSTSFRSGAYFNQTIFALPTEFSYQSLEDLHFPGCALHLVSFYKARMMGTDLGGARFPYKRRNFLGIFKDEYPVLLTEKLYTFQEDAYDEIQSFPESGEIIRTVLHRRKNTSGIWEVEEVSQKVSRREYRIKDLYSLLWSNFTDRVTAPVTYSEILRQYQEIKKTLENTGSPVEAGEFYFAEMEFKRHHDERGFRSWFHRTFRLTNLYRIINGYGERPWRCLTWIALWISVFSHIYLMTGIEHGMPRAITKEVQTAIESPQAGNRQIRSFVKDYALIDYDYAFRWPDWYQLLYKDLPIATEYAGRNVLPFIQRKDPSIQPKGPLTRWLTIIEQLGGAIFIAMFFLALRRRYRR